MNFGLADEFMPPLATGNLDWFIGLTRDLADVSGKSVKEHPEAKRMLADIKRGRIKGLIFSKLAHFARNTKELLEYADHFQQHGAALVPLDESIDASTPGHGGKAPCHGQHRRVHRGGQRCSRNRDNPLVYPT